MVHTKLASNHYQHLTAEGFTTEQINEFQEAGLIESLGPIEAAELFHQVKDSSGTPVTGGLLFKFSAIFSQLRVDSPELIQKPGEKLPRYLSPSFPIDNRCAYIPQGCQVITEGMKDALAFSVHGGIPTGAIAGVSHVSKVLSAGCGYTIVFDADAWENERVFLDLLKAGVHCAGKVAILPPVNGQPKAGGCEYFKAGQTAEDFKKMIDDARSPEQLAEEWIFKNSHNIIDVKSASSLAVIAGKAYGELFGYTSTTAKASIKQLVKSETFKEYTLDLNSVYSDSFNTKSAQRAKNREENEENKPVKVTLELVKEKCVFFHSQAPEVKGYVSIPTSPSVFKNVPVVSEAFEDWFIGEYYAVSGEGLTKDSVSQVLATAKAIAKHGSTQEFISTKRVCPFNDRHFLYLGDDDQTVVEYSDKGWWICLDSPVKFIADDHRGALPVPVKGGSIDKLWEFVRIVDISDRLLVLIFLVKLLFPGNTELLLCLSGYAGSGKTTAARFIRELLDPFLYAAVLGEIPDSKDELAIHCMKRCLVVIDNVSHIGKRLSDRLCKMLTGDGFTKRKQYTDLDEIALDCKSPVIMTAIGLVVTMSDLLQRTLAIELPSITEENRGSEQSLTNNFAKEHPCLLGALLDLACKSLAIKETTECQTYARFTEFAHLGESVQTASEYPDNTLRNRLETGVRAAHNVTIESSVVGSTLRSWIRDLKKWEGTAAELLNCLKSHAKKSDSSKALPSLPNKLTSELRMIEQALNQEGIEINYQKKKTGQHIHIATRQESENLSSPSSPEDKTATSQGFQGDDTPENPPSPDRHPSSPAIFKTPSNLASDCTSAGDDALEIHRHPLEAIKDNNYSEFEDKPVTVGDDTPENPPSPDEPIWGNGFRSQNGKGDDGDDKNGNVNSPDNIECFEKITRPQDPNDESTFDHDDEV
jgi:hypothetical protein